MKRNQTTDMTKNLPTHLLFLRNLGQFHDTDKKNTSETAQKKNQGSATVNGPVDTRKNSLLTNHFTYNFHEKMNYEFSL